MTIPKSYRAVTIHNTQGSPTDSLLLGKYFIIVSGSATDAF